MSPDLYIGAIILTFHTSGRIPDLTGKLKIKNTLESAKLQCRNETGRMPSGLGPLLIFRSDNLSKIAIEMQ